MKQIFFDNETNLLFYKFPNMGHERTGLVQQYTTHYKIHGNYVYKVRHINECV